MVIDAHPYSPCFESLSALGKIEGCRAREREAALAVLLLHCEFDRKK